MMKRCRIAFLVVLTFAVATPAAAALRAPKASPVRKDDKSLLAKPIEAMPPREEKPKAGWGGAYGGLNSGGAGGDR
jgi:hypothetical protein